MNLNSIIFQTAQNIANTYGKVVPVQELDPFFEACKYYQNKDLVIVAAKQLVGDEDGKLYRAERVIIHSLIDLGITEEELEIGVNSDLEFGDLGNSDNPDEAEAFEDPSEYLEVPIVYDCYLREDNVQCIEIFIKGEWLRSLSKLREQV